MADQITIKNLADLDGLSIKDAKRMPRPLELRRWSDAGFYVIDADMGVFRLTESGRNQITIKSSEAA